jgi:hypothetical protein
LFLLRNRNTKFQFFHSFCSRMPSEYYFITRCTYVLMNKTQ